MRTRSVKKIILDWMCINRRLEYESFPVRRRHDWNTQRYKQRVEARHKKKDEALIK